MYKVKNGDTRTTSIRCSNVFIADFGQISHTVLEFPSSGDFLKQFLNYSTNLVIPKT